MKIKQGLNIIENLYHDSSMVLNMEVSYLWHERLGHVGNMKIKKLMDVNLIPKSQIGNDKCEVCV